MGKWSETSVGRIPVRNLDISQLFVKILSIIVAVPSVTRVG